MCPPADKTKLKREVMNKGQVRRKYVDGNREKRMKNEQRGI